MNHLALSEFDLIRMMRDRETDPQRQKELARLEHQAFARQWVGENKLNALSLLPAIPAYQIGKGLGLVRGRTRDPWNQMAAGYRGLWEGLTQ